MARYMKHSFTVKVGRFHYKHKDHVRATLLCSSACPWKVSLLLKLEQTRTNIFRGSVHYTAPQTGLHCPTKPVVVHYGGTVSLNQINPNTSGTIFRFSYLYTRQVHIHHTIEIQTLLTPSSGLDIWVRKTMKFG